MLNGGRKSLASFVPDSGSGNYSPSLPLMKGTIALRNKSMLLVFVVKSDSSTTQFWKGVFLL